MTHSLSKVTCAAIASMLAMSAFVLTTSVPDAYAADGPAGVQAAR